MNPLLLAAVLALSSPSPAARMPPPAPADLPRVRAGVDLGAGPLFWDELPGLVAKAQLDATWRPSVQSRLAVGARLEGGQGSRSGASMFDLLEDRQARWLAMEGLVGGQLPSTDDNRWAWALGVGLGRGWVRDRTGSDSGPTTHDDDWQILPALLPSLSASLRVAVARESRPGVRLGLAAAYLPALEGVSLQVTLGAELAGG